MNMRTHKYLVLNVASKLKAVSFNKPIQVAAYLWGRRLDEYLIIIGEKIAMRAIDLSGDCNITEIQEKLTAMSNDS